MLNITNTARIAPIAKRPSLVETIQLWSARSRQRRTLKSLSASQLSDIGVCQNALIKEIRKPFWAE